MSKPEVYFLLLSLGSIWAIPVLGFQYHITYVEIYIIFLLSLHFIFGFKTQLKYSSTDLSYIIFLSGCFLYSLLVFFWSSAGLTILPGSLTIFWMLASYSVAIIYRNQFVLYFYKANRFLVVSITFQLLYTIFISTSFSASHYYALKAQSVTLMGASNFLSFFLVFVIIYEVVVRKKKWLFFSLLSFLGLFLTLSKAGFVSLFLGFIVVSLLIFFNKRSDVGKVKKNIFYGFLLLIVLMIAMSNTQFGMQLIQNTMYNISTPGAGRFPLWESAIKSINSNFFGNGITYVDDPHNIILKAFRDLGLFTGLVYLLLISYPILRLINLKTTIRLSNEELALIGGYSSILIHALLEIFYFDTLSAIWTGVLLMIMNQTYHMSKKKIGENTR